MEGARAFGTWEIIFLLGGIFLEAKRQKTKPAAHEEDKGGEGFHYVNKRRITSLPRANRRRPYM